VVTARISAVKAGLDISINDLEAHYLAGGNVVNVTNAMISADKPTSRCRSSGRRRSTWPGVICWRR
jgi:uncharacterized protein YqfA (UPF0365 family)